MTGIRSHEDLIVWQRAMEVVEQVYALARRFPRDERFALTSQITRAAVSIPANIAEGHGRMGKREFAQFLSIASGSLAELRTLIEIAVRLGYATVDDVSATRSSIDETSRMLTALITRLRAAGPKASDH